MTRLRLARWSGQLLHARPGAATAAIQAPSQPFLTTVRCQSAVAVASAEDVTPPSTNTKTRRSLPSPLPSQAAQSAKLAALHARLSLPPKVPLQTLARALISHSADANTNFNNANLAYLGSTILNYHVLEYLVCKWPRLPMPVLYEALRAYAGRDCLHMVARRWGVEAAAAPGAEVDPGLLQWTYTGAHATATRWGYLRSDKERAGLHRRGISSRVVLDDDFGDQLDAPTGGEPALREHFESEAFAGAVQAVVGGVYTHCGREAAKAFVKSHVLSRQFDPSSLFAFKVPTRELAMLCAREGFEPPLARLESETGRASRTPVFVVGIYSGKEKLGEGAAASLDMARRKASMSALKAWYLYSPGNKVRVPSDTMEAGARKWTPPHIDIGEIV